MKATAQTTIKLTMNDDLNIFNFNIGPKQYLSLAEALPYSLRVIIYHGVATYFIRIGTFALDLELNFISLIARKMIQLYFFEYKNR